MDCPAAQARALFLLLDASLVLPRFDEGKQF
jgi:hypothetical protein